MTSPLLLCMSFLTATAVLIAYMSNTESQGYSNKEAENQWSGKQMNFTPANSSNIQLFNNKFESNNAESDELENFNQSDIFNFDLSSFLNNPQESCVSAFKCSVDLSTGWNDITSIQLSTNNTNKASRIIGQEVKVDPSNRYELVMHIKQNEWSTNSDVRLEGFNTTSNDWYPIDQCPSASLNGRLQWQEFSCGYTIKEDTSKVRPILKAGWSAEHSKRAITWFDSLHVRPFSPILHDPNLKAELVTQGLDGPVSMAFLGRDDFLVIENNGAVQRIVNGVKLTKPLLVLNVEKAGLLGIAVNNYSKAHKSIADSKNIYVFLYFASLKEQDNKFLKNEDIFNYLYRYELVNNSLINPKLMLVLPFGFHHNGGPILIGPDKESVYLSVGDTENETFHVIANKALNNRTGKDPDGTGGILRVTQDGNPLSPYILGTTYPFNIYHAYGIRQSFGMDFDPLTGKLWDTENGANWGDEINLVEPGFNGGWNKIQGIWRDHVRDNFFNATDVVRHPSDLEDFDGKGKYRTPEFTWKYTVGPTALKFLSSDKLGKEYQNDIFVGDVNYGRIYHFELNHNRTGLLLQGPLRDKVADTDGELESVIFAEGFGIITDLKVGPDGYLYFVANYEGRIYRIVPRI